MKVVCSTHKIAILILASLLFSSAGTMPVYAEKVSGYVIGNAQQAARLVKAKYGGKVLKVQRTNTKGNPGYKVKILKDNGHVMSIKVDAKTGRVSGK